MINGSPVPVPLSLACGRPSDRTYSTPKVE